MSDLLTAGLRTAIPAIVVALVGHFFFVRWQQRYWRVRRYIEQQESLHGDAKRVLVRAARFPESYIQSPSESDQTRGRQQAEPQHVAIDLELFTQDQTDLASLANDVPRFFSPRSDTALADAASTLTTCRARIMRLDSGAAFADQGVTTDLLEERLAGILTVRNALSIMSSELGRVNPVSVRQRVKWRIGQARWRWLARRFGEQVPRMGRRETDPVRAHAPHEPAQSERRRAADDVAEQVRQLQEFIAQQGVGEPGRGVRG